jgi:hypothetical protein
LDVPLILLDVSVNFQTLNNRKAYDYDPSNMDATAWSHAVLPVCGFILPINAYLSMQGSLNPHKMKLDEQYLDVAALFNEFGLDLSRVPNL